MIATTRPLARLTLLLAVLALLSGCMVDRRPLAAIKPSYSYLRDPVAIERMTSQMPMSQSTLARSGESTRRADDNSTSLR
jgi:ABC-type uncharacterized transport system auxiliary subunit